MGETILRLEKVSKRFGKNEVLKDITLDIKPGEIIGVIGASGSGKTTLLNLLVGFFPPNVGKVLFNSPSVVKYDEQHKLRPVLSNAKEVKRMIGFAAQEASFYRELTLAENLDLFGSLYGLSRDAKQTNALILLKLMGLYEYRKNLSGDISGGMQKRLDIACALIHDPQILILDEPTADLDPHLRAQMWKLIKKINSKGTTVILSSHFLDELEDVCDRIGILSDGKLKHMGTPSELKRLVSADEEVHIETLKGEYDALTKAFEPKKRYLISQITNTGSHLIIRTGNAHVVIEKLLKFLDKKRDVLINLHVERPTLNEVFEEVLFAGDKP